MGFYMLPELHAGLEPLVTRLAEKRQLLLFLLFFHRSNLSAKSIETLSIKHSGTSVSLTTQLTTVKFWRNDF